METIFVTGGAGFIGSHLVPKLVDRGYAVRILDNLSPQIHGHFPAPLSWLHLPNVEFVRGSLTDAIDWAALLDGVDRVVHLAAETGTGQSMYEVARYNGINSQGTALLMERLAGLDRGRIKRIVLASSRSIYGEGAYRCTCTETTLFPAPRTGTALQQEQWEHMCSHCGQALTAIPTPESAPAQPASVYAATKVAQEDLVKIVAAASMIDYAVLRFQNVYGEGQSLNNPYTGILSIFSTRIRRDLELPIFEDGHETRDFVHVSDVVEAVIKALVHEGVLNDTVNVGSGIATSVATIARGLSTAMGKTPNIRVTAEYRLGDIRHNVADIRMASDVLGFQPAVPLTEGLRRFAAWTHDQPLPEDQLERANQELRARKLMN